MDEAMRLRVQRNAAHLPIGHRHGQCAGEDRDGERPPANGVQAHETGQGGGVA